MIKLLVVDDEPLARERLIAMLGEFPDVEVAGEAGNGREAVEKALALGVDALLLDIAMPVMDGLEAARPPAVAGDIRRRSSSAPPSTSTRSRRSRPPRWTTWSNPCVRNDWPKRWYVPAGNVPDSSPRRCFRRATSSVAISARACAAACA
jgi:hypothetical protein